MCSLAVSAYWPAYQTVRPLVDHTKAALFVILGRLEEIAPIIIIIIIIYNNNNYYYFHSSYLFSLTIDTWKKYSKSIYNSPGCSFHYVTVGATSSTSSRAMKAMTAIMTTFSHHDDG